MTPSTRATRERILAGAGRAFARLGIRGTSVRDILEEAEVSRRTFYQYFSGQEAVLLALYEQEMDDMLQTVVSALDVPDDQRLDSAVGAYLGFHQRRGRLLTLLMSDAMTADSPLRPHRERVLIRLEDVLGQITEQERGYRLDPHMYRALTSGLTVAVLGAKRDGVLSDADAQRLSAVIQAMIAQVLTAGDHHPAVIQR